MNRRRISFSWAFAGRHPAIRPTAFREPNGAGPVWGNQNTCNNLWTRSVKPEDFLGRLRRQGQETFA